MNFLGPELWFGVLGGIFSELLGLHKIKHVSPLPHFLKSLFFWVITLLMILAGGMLAQVYAWSGISLHPIIAVNIGASAPLLISSLGRFTPEVGMGRSDSP